VLLVSIALGVAIFLAVQADTLGKSMLRCGDFPGFYAPAWILAEGRGGELYSRSLQHEVENRFWPGMQQGVLVSVYPAFFAVALMPLAHLPPNIAKWLFAFVCLGGFALFARLGVPKELRSNLPYTFRLAALALFPASFISIVGGQNTGLTVGILAVVMWGLHSRTRLGNFLAGVALAALLYKPQFGLMLLWPMLLWRQWWVMLGAAITAPLLYLLAVPWVGVQWGAAWLEAVQQFAPENFLVNGQLMVSPLSALYVLGVETGGLGLVLTGLSFAVVVYLVTRRSQQATPELFAIVLAVTAFFSPQALLYDLGLVTPLLLFNVLREGDRALWRYLGWGVMFAASHALREYAPIPVLQLLSLTLIVCEARRLVDALAGAPR